MPMELGTAGGFASARWTSTAIAPFGPAPFGGRGLGAYSDLSSTGFQANPMDTQNGIVMDPILVLGKGPFTVKKEPVQAGQIPSMVIRMRYTDRGTLTQAVLDAQVRTFLQKANYKVSKKSTFTPVDVTWRWAHDTQADFYYPVVATPTQLDGMRYAGNAVQLPVYSADPKVIAALPSQIWVYTMAITTAHDTMTDGDAAQALTLLKQAMVNMDKAQAYAHVELTLRGCPPTLFSGSKVTALPKPAKTAFSALILLVAYNMLSPHIGSEVL